MFTKSIVLAAACLATANAHIIMQNPVPYGTPDNSPLLSTGANFPCKHTQGADDMTISKQNSIAVGSKQQISFKGSAVHGGGLCQLSVAVGQNVTTDMKFKVIKTIEGGCPGLDSSTSTFDYELPDSIPNGQNTFAWTWMPVSSGGPEYYMNCAPIEVSGGASDESKFEELPDMLVANLDTTTCTQVVNTVLEAPNPGSVVENGGGSAKTSPPTGDCGATGSGNSTGGESSSAASGQPATSAAGGSPSSAAGGAPTSAAAEPSTAPTSAAASNPGGVFAPSASGGAAQSTMTTLVTVTAAPSVDTPSVPVGTGTSPQPTSGAGGEGSSCSTDGAVVCNGEDQFGLCNDGKVVWQAVAAGTKCSNGSIQKRGYNGRVARPRAQRAI